MKPIKLTIQNFISYRGAPAVIDFSDYRCLFLISGNTGAGKTTIFDAMTYALFGEISAEETNFDGSAMKNGRTKCIRCENAPDDEDTVVALQFEHQGKKYEIRRGLSKRKNRADGKVYYDKDFALMMGDGMSPLEKSTKINEKIDEMLGLDAKQWRNVVMLAQSQFMSFLKAGTPERTKILNKLFDTSRFERISQRLKEMEKEVRTDNTTDLKRIADISKSFSFTEGSEAKIEFDALNGTDPYTEAENILEIFDKALESDRQTKSQLTESLKILQKNSDDAQAAYNEAKTLCEHYRDLRKNETDLSSLNERADEFTNKKHVTELARKAAASVNPQYQTFQHANKDLLQKNADLEEQKRQIPILEKKKADSEKELEIALVNSGEEPQLRAAIGRIEPLLNKYEELDNARASEKKLNGEIDNLNKTIESDRIKMKRTEDDLKVKEKFVNENMDVGQRLEAAKYAGKELERKVQGLQRIKETYEALCKSEKTKSDAENERIDAQQRFDSAESDYDSILNRHNAHSAGILAQDLVPGCRCPVCGSLDHPSPAKLPDDAPTEDDVKKAKQKERETRDELDKASEQCTIKTQNYEYLKSSFETDTAEYEVPQSDDVLMAIGIKLSESTEEVRKNTKQISELENIQKTFDESNEGIDHLKTQKSILETSLKENNERVRELGTSHAEKKALIDTLSKDLSEFESRSEAERAIADLRNRADDLKKTLECANTAFNDAKEALSVGLDKERNLKSDVDNLSVTETQSRTAFEKARSDAGFADEAEFLRYLKLHERIEEFEKEIADYNDRCTTLRSSIVTLKTQIAGRPEPENLDEFNSRKESCSVALSEANHKLGAISANISSNDETRKRFGDLYKKTKESRFRQDMISELVSVYEGNRGAGVKISFNQYVLGGYLDTIVANATRRLKEMSCGRYELRRVEKATSVQGSNALDLDIFDNHNCHRRSINTLSGGEAFMTALALSLSISDTIQTSARGKTVEGLFIDEGFGTLDDNTRNLAVNTLKQMSNDRISIGIISHVEDLKTVIEKGMEVTYDPTEGSKIHFY